MSSDTRQKKTKGRIVPSRYKLSADSIASSSGTSSETLNTFSRKPSNLLNATAATFNRTELNVNIGRKTTSTPDQNFKELPTFNASAITSTGPYFGATQKKDIGKRTASKHSVLKKASTSVLPSGPIKCKELKSDPNQVAKAQKLELDIYYGQYQLNLYLENKIRESMVKMSEVALEKIYKVMNFISLFISKRECIQKELHKVSFTINLHEHLQKQEKILLPFLEVIPTLEKQYKEIAIGVDNIRHNLQVEDVSLPSGSESEIIKLLQNISNLLDQIQTVVSNIDEINLVAKNANTIVSQGKLIQEEINRGTELISEARELLLSETSSQLASLALNKSS